MPSLKNEITADSAWCATFQLVWNDMKNEYVKQDIFFAEASPVTEQMVRNLNAESFTEDMISNEYYYKTWGKKTLEKKTEIEKAIKDKFNAKSDVLHLIDWEKTDTGNSDYERMIFYTMLKREFEYPKKFSKLDEGTFGGKYENVKYFGIDNSTKDEIDSQVRVLFYESDEDYAVVLKTKNGDEVVLYKNPLGKTFEEIYENLIAKSTEYKGSKYFEDIDQLKVPYITMDVLRDYQELCGEYFYTADGKKAIIEQALQTINFELDEAGGRIKSEATISMMGTTSLDTDIRKPRYFYFDDTFALFLKEESKYMPYFATVISDITKYQN